MPERQATVGSPVGLHARPAAVIAQIAAKHRSTVHIGRVGGEQAQAHSMLGLMGLGIRPGERVLVRANGDGADEVLDELVSAIEAIEPSALGAA